MMSNMTEDKLLSQNGTDDDKIVISGMSGKYPNSDDLVQFRENLLNKIDLIREDHGRWNQIHPEIPPRMGVMNDIGKFDAGFFGLGNKSTYTDPMVRIVLEKTFEAILDAGYNPAEFADSNTGVYIGASFSDSEQKHFYTELSPKSNSIIGHTRSMLGNQVSYFFKLQGPSYVSDTACSSSIYALQHAYKAIREGKCNKAVVSSVSLLLHPFITLQFARLGVLSMDGRCKCFDDNANGYVRSESVSVIILEKAKDARRIYARIEHIKTNSDGYKEEGINFPSTHMQEILMKEVHEECGIDPRTVTFVEAHGTGTKVGDPEELKSLDLVFCTDRKKPLYIGSTKSNVGHPEPASGLVSVIKVLLGMDCGYIPPNINFKSRTKDLDAIKTGRMVVVTDKMPWPENNVIVGVNNFGFGGANAHLLLTRNKKEKLNKGLPTDNLPRLVCVAGRTEAAVNIILGDLKERKLDAEYVKILHTIFRTEIANFSYRGFSILTKIGEVQRSSWHCLENRKKFILFGNYDRNWLKIGSQLLEFPLFKKVIERIRNVLIRRTNNNKSEMLVNFNEDNGADIVLSSVAVQIGLAYILKKIGITVNGVIGVGTGELVAAYFDEFLTLEESILVAFYIGTSINNIKFSTLKEHNDADKNLYQNMKKLLPQNNRTIKTWIPLWNDNLKDICSQGSVEYLINNIKQPVNSGLEMKSVPSDADVLLISQSSYKTQPQNFIRLVQYDANETTTSFLRGLGRLYEIGVDMKLDELYPQVEWPVSRGTPMISPLIKLDHEKDWHVYYYRYQKGVVKSICHSENINTKESNWGYVTGHVIDGRNLFPATGYLLLTLETLANTEGKLISNMRVVFEDVKFIRAASIPKDAAIDLVVLIQRGSRRFEILESGAVLVTGKIYEVENEEEDIVNLPLPPRTELVLKKNDIYKELKLRGYNYKGEFCSIKECNLQVSMGYIKWTQNWVTFMDNMLQMLILQKDSRNLYVPTNIDMLIIDGMKQTHYGAQVAKDGLFPVYSYKELEIIKSIGIEIRGFNASVIHKRKGGEPVLETYKFVPNDAVLQLHQAVRAIVQIALENTNTIKVKTVEVVDDNKCLDLISPLIQKTLGEMPLIQPEIIILSKQTLEFPGISSKSGDLKDETDCFLTVVSNALGKKEQIHSTIELLKCTNGYVISREDQKFDHSLIINTDINIICSYKSQSETLVLFRRSTEVKQNVVIDITDESESLNWLPILQNFIKTNQKIIMYCKQRFVHGILGLINCLRKEIDEKQISCFFIVSDAPEFNLNHDFYKKQLRKNLMINVWVNGKWGTYRHLLLDNCNVVQSEHCYVEPKIRGNLSSLSWSQGYLNRNSIEDIERLLVYVYYSAVNFKDIMTASGRIQIDDLYKERTLNFTEGMEFSGRDSTGRRVMGIVFSKALSTLVMADTQMLWTVPDNWSLEQAATVPIVYGTVVYALITRGNLKRGESILIHSGTGGVGQAAIYIALYYGCTVFTTVGTQEKRQFIRKQFPQIKDRHIGNSRDTSFEEMIYKETKGHGVDLVLNSLADEKLQASVRCLAFGGRFLEIGKFDLINNSKVAMEIFLKQASFQGVMVDTLFFESTGLKEEFVSVLRQEINKGSVKPLNRTVFKDSELEKSFRFMTSGTHIGKVLIQIREEEKDLVCHPTPKIMNAIPKFHCNPYGTYVILGGLGGFGLELTDWLVIRGARNIVLSSRTGIKTGYQAFRINIWKSYGTRVLIRLDDITAEDGCLKLIKCANELGPVQGIFNLAVLLKDGLFENQTVKDFRISLAPKAQCTKYLDVISRKLCPQLKQFVVFSSVSCGRGNAGQTNYGMSNSIMERICEQRKADGYPGLAIQWGAVGDVGIVAEMQQEHKELVIGGTLQQKIGNCIEVLDTFLGQDQAVVSSMVVAEKNTISTENDIINTVANLIGINDLKTVSIHSPLSELGMDSMMGVEVKQTLEREYDVIFSQQDIRTLTFAKLRSIANEKNETKNLDTLKHDDLPVDLELLLRYIGDESSANIPVVELQTMADKSANPPIIMLPGIEGMAVILQPLAKNLMQRVKCLQFCAKNNSETIEEMVKLLIPYIEKNEAENFRIVAYSFGTVVAVELVHQLEKKGHKGKVVFIDGSPDFVQKVWKSILQNKTEEEFQMTLLYVIMMRHMNFKTILKYKADFDKCKTFLERIKLMLTISPNAGYSQEYLIHMCQSAYKRIKASINYQPNFAKLKSPVKLMKPTKQVILNIENDYKLSAIFENANVFAYEGNHATILENTLVAKVIDEFMRSDI